ncbi:MAG: hypothetical protein DLM73_06525 [Chthoniobacterales bacterium]|nr:MAG: hypothetical protein DLM73_06525 [Chthoniobacterales bacterium]
MLGKGTTVERAFVMLIDMSLLIYFVPYIYLFVCLMVHCWRRRSDRILVIPGGRIGALVAGLCGLSITLRHARGYDSAARDSRYLDL